ncbi:MAG: nucleotidyltransferase family protein [Solirubrobacterales bacterium]
MSTDRDLAGVQRRLLLDGAALEILGALRAAEIEALLLKGPTIEQDLYPPGSPRTYVDVDALIDPAEVGRAGAVLEQAGFELESSDDLIEPFAEPHASVWRRRDGVAVDLHWRIPFVGADPGAVWGRLSRERDSIALGRSRVPTLARPARALHLALHALQGGVQGGKSMVELAYGIERLEPELWREAALLAAELEASEALSVALRMSPDGARLADRLGLAPETATKWQLWVDRPSPQALRIEALASTSGASAKLRALTSALFPPSDYIRALAPAAREGRLGLAKAYAIRLGAAFRSGPKTAVAVFRARRSRRNR